MNCTTCRLPSAYNRAVVDTASEEVVGCLCTQCIRDFFGRTLSACDRDGCLLCEREGAIALPKWRCTSVEDDETVVITGLDTPVRVETPRICVTHLDELKASKFGADSQCATDSGRTNSESDNGRQRDAEGGRRRAER